MKVMGSDKLTNIPKRQEWVDIAKGIAITAVVLGHINFMWPNYDILPLRTLFITLWHVPVFFIIGGFFIKEDKLISPQQFIKGKFKSLYLLILYLYIPVLLLHNFFIDIGIYDINLDYSGNVVTRWDYLAFCKHLLLAIFFAGREPILGAMWFVYVLFMALCILSIVSWSLRKLIKDVKKYAYIRFIVLLIGAVASCILTKKLGITIPRASNTITAVWLIYIGMMLMKRYKIQFNNTYVLAISVVIVYHIGTVWGG